MLFMIDGSSAWKTSVSSVETIFPPMLVTTRSILVKHIMAITLRKRPANVPTVIRVHCGGGASLIASASDWNCWIILIADALGDTCWRPQRRFVLSAIQRRHMAGLLMPKV